MGLIFRCDFLSKIRATKVLSYCFSGNGLDCCYKFIELEGLALLLQSIKGKDNQRFKRRYKTFVERDYNEHLISILFSVFKFFHSDESIMGFLMAQLYRKELFLLKLFFARMNEYKEHLNAYMKDLPVDEMSTDEIYFEKLDNGLLPLEMQSVIIAIIYSFSDDEVNIY